MFTARPTACSLCVLCGRKNWSQAWVVLVGNSLVFFKDPKAQTPSSWVGLCVCVCVCVRVRVNGWSVTSRFYVCMVRGQPQYVMCVCVCVCVSIETRKQPSREQCGPARSSVALGQRPVQQEGSVQGTHRHTDTTCLQALG